MEKFCHSCGMPLTGGQEPKAQGNYCGYCCDEKGNLYPREQVLQGIAQWLQGFGDGQAEAVYVKRAEHYLKAMPAWAEN